MNCLLQKALKDRVFNNRCFLDSVLWFHLECPKEVEKFDDPIQFKRKFKEFFGEIRSAGENITAENPTQKRVKDEYNHISYPEDVREHKEYRLFQETFKDYSPINHVEPADEYDQEDIPYTIDPIKT